MTELMARDDRAPERNTLALDVEQEWWSKAQLSGLQQIGIGEASPGDKMVFLHVCQRTGLDPFARQIHMVKRWSRDGDKWTIQTGIDGFRLVADRTDRRDGTARSYEDTLWCDRDGNWTDVWLKNAPPAAAKVTIYRDGHKFSATVMYAEYVQTKKGGEPTAMWASMPANQLAKCAEAQALRKGYPQDLSGVYSDDEMGQADNHGPVAKPRTRPVAEVLDAEPDETPADAEDIAAPHDEEVQA